MSCIESLDLLQRRLDGEAIDDRAGLSAHLAECLECRERHGAARRMNEALRLLTHPAPPPGLSARIVARALAERHASFRFRRRVMAAAAIAAGLLLASLAALHMVGPSADGPDQTGAKVPPAGGTKKVLVKKNRVDVEHPLDEALNEAGTATVALTRKAADGTMARARQWLPRAALPSFSLQPLQGAEFAPVLDPIALTLRQAGEAISSGIEPVTTSAPRAIHACASFVGMFLQDAPAPPIGKKT